MLETYYCFFSAIPDRKLVTDDDPENARHEFAFDNPAFKGNSMIF